VVFLNFDEKIIATTIKLAHAKVSLAYLISKEKDAGRR
jgi:hypothetical protein